MSEIKIGQVWQNIRNGEKAEVIKIVGDLVLFKVGNIICYTPKQKFLNWFSLENPTPAQTKDGQKHDNINPSHYKSHPSGVECIAITEHMNFCLGNAVKYIWRAGLKTDNAIEDLQKAKWYIEREIERLKK
ncbi:DUF3310 domain-containing protein [Moraxella nasovis]|uniref:DUF3310 domain-containing protein n=1 Tax=Moraxella nasovis TaxID=2904121 RepID=UPI001F61B1EA|nr:DUF3310 domain-containing protein [Moraxella nasovis]UNU74125.1 DUF3310 domain-containing protein [Moraxella nasovis]